MKYGFYTRVGLVFTLVLLISSLSLPAESTNAAASSDLTPNQLTFTGRRGTSYNVSWNPSTYEFTFSTPDSTFPWDWISWRRTDEQHYVTSIALADELRLLLLGSS